MGSNNSFILNLVLTEKCNLNCKYCYVDKTQKEMSYEIIDKAIAFMEKESINMNEINIEIFGGEPLLAFDKIKYLTEKIKTKPYTNRTRISLFTNCILLNNDEICKYLIENSNLINFNISLDGGEKSQNATRAYPNGENSYKDTINGIKNYCRLEGSNLGERFMPGFTISPDNCEFLLESIIEMYNIGFKKIALKPVRDDVWDSENLIKYKNAVIELKDWYIKNIDKEIELSLFKIPIELETQERPRYCNGGKNFYSITPEGDIYPCPRFYLNKSPYKLGDLFNKNYFTDKLYTNLFTNYKVSNYVDCSKCEMFKEKACLGMCIAASYEANKKLFTTIPCVCEIIKFNYQISKEIEQNLKDNIHYKKIMKPRY